MTRRPRWLVPSAITIAAILVTAVGVFTPIACNDTTPPPIQTVAKDERPVAEIVQPPTPEEKKEAADRLDRAIKAQGGPEHLRTKLRIIVQRMKGQMFYPDEGMVRIEQELKTQLPDRLRLHTVAFRRQGREEGAITVSGNVAWFTLGGLTKPMGEAERADLNQEVAFRRTTNLQPLKDEEFVVRPVEGEPMSGQPTVGLLVGSKKFPATRYYFDAKSNLLVRTLCKAWPEGSAIQQREILFSGHKPFDGVMLPTEYTDKRNGQVVLTLKIDYSFPEKLDEKEFTPP
jgi:hypothetical protein